MKVRSLEMVGERGLREKEGMNIRTLLRKRLEASFERRVGIDCIGAEFLKKGAKQWLNA